jgi:hypothetical protein
MLRQDQLRTLKQTHQTASTVMPLVTAGLAVMSALIAAQERRASAAPLPERHPEREPEGLDMPRVVRITTPRASAPAPRPITQPIAHMAETAAPAPERRASLIGSLVRYVTALVGTLVKVMFGALAVIAIVALYVHLERSNRTALLTVLIVSVLYLTARVARSRQRRS